MAARKSKEESAVVDVDPDTIPPNEKPNGGKSVKKVQLSVASKIQAKVLAERQKKVANYRRQIDADDKKKFAEEDKRIEEERKEVKRGVAERRRIEAAQEEAKAQRRQEEAEARETAKSERKTTRQATRRAASGACDGSNVNVADWGVSFAKDKDPWARKGKRVKCKVCGASKGVHMTGDKAAKKPTAYLLNPHPPKAKGKK